jgi:hypothetical protein
MEMKNKKFKIQILSIIFFITFIFFTSVQAAGLIPCGGKGERPCQICDFFVLFQNIVDFVLFRIVPPLAALFLVIGGVMFFFAGASPSAMTGAKKLFTSVMLGLVIIYGAWVFVNTFFMLIGINEWTGLKTWWKFSCP